MLNIINDVREAAGRVRNLRRRISELTEELHKEEMKLDRSIQYLTFSRENELHRLKQEGK